MKNFIFTIALILCHFDSFCQQIEWASKVVSRNAYLIGHDVDKQGNTYAIFSYGDSLWLDAKTLLVPKKNNGAILVRIDNTGKLDYYKHFTAGVPSEYTYIKDIKIDDNNNINIIGSFLGNLRIVPHDTSIALKGTNQNTVFAARLTSDGSFIDAKIIDNQLFNNTHDDFKFEKNRKFDENIIYVSGLYGGSIVFDKNYNFKWKNEQFKSNICKDKQGNVWVINFPQFSNTSKSDISLNQINIENGEVLSKIPLFQLTIANVDYISGGYITFRIEDINSKEDLLLLGDYWGKIDYLGINNDKVSIENFNTYAKSCCDLGASKKGYFCRITKEGKIHWIDDKISSTSVFIPSENSNQITTIANRGKFFKNSPNKDLISNKSFANLQALLRIPSIIDNNTFILAMQVADTMFYENGNIFPTNGYENKGKKRSYKWGFAKFNTKTTVIADNEIENESIYIFPNPAQNFIQLKPKINSSNYIDELSIYDINGKLLILNKNISIESQINIQNLANGLYLIKAKVEDKWFISKFIKIE